MKVTDQRVMKCSHSDIFVLIVTKMLTFFFLKCDLLTPCRCSALGQFSLSNIGVAQRDTNSLNRQQHGINMAHKKSVFIEGQQLLQLNITPDISNELHIVCCCVPGETYMHFLYGPVLGCFVCKASCTWSQHQHAKLTCMHMLARLVSGVAIDCLRSAFLVTTAPKGASVPTKCEQRRLCDTHPLNAPLFPRWSTACFVLVLFLFIY